MLLNRTVCCMALLIATLSGCQRDEPPHKAAGGEAPNGGTENGTAVVTDSQPVDVQVTNPVRQPLVYTIPLPANISPRYQTTLYAKVSGYLKWIGPDKGDHVNTTQVVALLAAPEVEEQYQIG